MKFVVVMVKERWMKMTSKIEHPTVWIVQDDQLKIYNGGNLVASIPDYQFAKMIVKLAEHLDSMK